MSQDTKRPRRRTARHVGFGILNPWGDMWTSEVFSTQEAARDHLAAFWRGSSSPPDLTRYRIVRARQVAHYVGEVEP